jgi:RNA polymerase sigma-70 factor, ECF subfamily
VTDDPGDIFEAHRGLLFGVAYRMLSSADEADDIVQETWLRWNRANRSQVSEPRAYLIQIATRVSLDHLRRAATAREAYVGPWLPEPLLTGALPATPDVADEVALAESVSLAMLVVLETLSPLERAVFVLREAFGFGYREIGEALGRSEQSVRQLGHRAREHVQARQPRFKPRESVRRAATERFMQAAVGGDLAALLKVLAPDVTLVSDSGGKTRSPRRPIHGADKVARFFVATVANIPAGTEVHLVGVNGAPAAVTAVGSAPYALFFLDVDARTHRITTIRLISNPDKLSRIGGLTRRPAVQLAGSAVQQIADR